MKFFTKLFLSIILSALLTLSLQAQNTSVTFNATGAAQTYTVPTGITQITIDMAGAIGGGGGGKGGRVQARLTVTAGQVLNLYVGKKGNGSGNPGWNGGGGSTGYTGGDASDTIGCCAPAPGKPPGPSPRPFP